MRDCPVVLPPHGPVKQQNEIHEAKCLGKIEIVTIYNTKKTVAGGTLGAITDNIHRISLATKPSKTKSCGETPNRINVEIFLFVFHYGGTRYMLRLPQFNNNF